MYIHTCICFSADDPIIRRGSSFWYHLMYAMLFPDAGLLTRKQNTDEVILQIPSSFCPISHWKVTNTDKNNHKVLIKINFFKYIYNGCRVWSVGSGGGGVHLVINQVNVSNTVLVDLLIY